MLVQAMLCAHLLCCAVNIMHFLKTYFSWKVDTELPAKSLRCFLFGKKTGTPTAWLTEDTRCYVKHIQISLKHSV